MIKPSAALFFEFGNFQLDVSNRLLTRGDGTPVKLARPAFKILSYLVEHSGTIVRSDRLLKAVWPDVAARNYSLQRYIVALRRALGEKSEMNHYIVTVLGEGYWFRAEVKVSADLTGKRVSRMSA